MIPAIIHYFWDGPQLNNEYIKGWAKLCPGYKIVHWNFQNIPVKTFPKLQELVDKKKYSIISDFIRHWALYNYGGFYFDTDIELIRSLEPLRSLQSFTCIEGPPAFANSAACGSVPMHWFQQKAFTTIIEFDFYKLFARILEGFENKPPEIVVGPWLVSKLLKEIKGSPIDLSDMEDIKHYPDYGFTSLPKRYFYPYNYNEKLSSECITPDTYGIHYWEKNWKK